MNAKYILAGLFIGFCLSLAIYHSAEFYHVLVIVTWFGLVISLLMGAWWVIEALFFQRRMRLCDGVFISIAFAVAQAVILGGLWLLWWVA